MSKESQTPEIKLPWTRPPADIVGLGTHLFAMPGTGSCDICATAEGVRLWKGTLAGQEPRQGYGDARLCHGCSERLRAAVTEFTAVVRAIQPRGGRP